MSTSTGSPPYVPSIVTDIPDPRTSTMDSSAPDIENSTDESDFTQSLDPRVYLSSATFHCEFTCKRTQSLVSYSDCGDPNGPLVFHIPPSGCSRLVGVFLDGYAREKGIRLITPDRAGQGRTPRVPLESRIDVACEQTISLIEHVNATDVTFMTHSAGV